MPSQTPSASTYAERDTAKDITFAVELKFLIRQDLHAATSKYGNVRRFVPHRPEEARNSMTQPEIRLWQDNWEAIAKSINALPGVNATCKHQMQAQRPEQLWKTHWMVYKANSACPEYLTYHQEDPDRPVFDTNAPDYKKYVWTPVEICSPILSWTQQTEALAALTAILKTINKQFDVVANPSTECHVHIGRLDGKFYSLTTMKKLATLFWLAEPLLRALKDPNSPNNDRRQHYTWSFPLRDRSRIGMALARALPSVDELYTGGKHAYDDFLADLADVCADWSKESSQVLREHRPALRAIWRAADHSELAHMLRGPEHKLRRLGFNFYALEEDANGESVPRTVEFRFLDGFIDSQVVPAWVRLCGELIDLVVDQDGEGEDNMEFYGVVAALVSVPQDWSKDAQFAAFMQALGRDRIPRSVFEQLRAVIRKNYTP